MNKIIINFNSKKEKEFLSNFVDNIGKTLGITIEGGIDDSPEKFPILINTIK